MNTVLCRNAHGETFTTPVAELTQRMSAFAVLIQNGKLLMTRQWDGHALPGGGVEVGESLEQAVVREVHEETGLQVTPVKLQQYADVYFRHRADSPAFHCHMFYFACEVVSGTISRQLNTSSEQTYVTDDPEWVPLEQLDDIVFRHSVPLSKIMSVAT